MHDDGVQCGPARRDLCAHGLPAGLLTFLIVGAAHAANLYSSGSMVWDTVSTNWGTSQFGPYTEAVWSNATPDSAHFLNSAGTVMLAEPITIRQLRFEVANHVVSSNTLTFVAGGSITNAVKNGKDTIASAIDGSPNVGVINGTSYEGLTFAPVIGSVTLGTVTVPYDDPVGGDKAGVRFEGTTQSNSAARVRFDGGDRYGAIYKDGSGTWRVGDVDIGTAYLNAGHLIADGYIRTYYQGLRLQGATLHWNNPGAVYNGLTISSGTIDNTSGGAITSATYNTAQTWAGDWSFIGSQGTNSDLSLGSGTVTLSGNRTVTVSNAFTTLTIDGVVDDGTQVYGLTKAGAGTLRLTQANTYNGSTTVAGGTLALGQPSLDAMSVVTLTNNGSLHLDFNGTNTLLALVFDGALSAPGTWGAPGSGAEHTTNLLSGDGLLAHNGGLTPEGIWLWDGANTGGVGNALSDGGAGAWSTSVTNWDQGLTTRKAWPNTTNDVAIFRTVAGQVVLGSDITLGGLHIDGANTYTIGSTAGTHALHFGDSSTVTVHKVDAVIRAGITGAPFVDYWERGNSHSDYLKLEPAAGVRMELGDIKITKSGFNNLTFYFGGNGGTNMAQTFNAPTTPHVLGIYKTGQSTWSVGDVNATRAGWNVQGGKMIFRGNVTGGDRSVVVESGATLAGTGTFSLPITVNAGATLEPGDPTGTLTVTNKNCTIRGSLAIHVDGRQPNGWSTLSVGGSTLDITGATLDVSVAGIPSEQNLVIASYTTLIGTFAVINGLPPNWEVDYAHNDGTAIALSNPGLALMIFVR